MAAPVVHIADLVFRWGGTPCLDIASFDLKAGEKAFLHGPSGSGKSTLLNLLAGVLVPAAGELAVLGQALPRLAGAARDRFRADHVGIVFQQFNLIPYLSVLDNVLLPCRFSKLRQERADDPKAAAARLLAHLDLERTLWRRRADALSVGQQQRVAAARALIGHPELVIADEPTSALDAERQAAFLELLIRECDDAGSALLFVSHDRRLASRFDRVLALPDINRAGERPS
jgi:putative ABC transport system ATP-binding protein